MFEFVTACNNSKVLEANLLRSNWIKKYPITVLHGFTNIAQAYNSITPSQNFVVYVHTDVFLPDSFEKDLHAAVKEAPADWSVLGVAGVRLIDGKKQNIGYINDRGNLWGRPINSPIEVQTLDEMLVVTKGDLRFDEKFAQDFYAADLCMKAQLHRKKCFVFNGYCEHNSTRVVGGRTTEFYIAEDLFRNKWKDHLDIATTCTILRK